MDNSSSSVWRDAVMVDGAYVLRQATTRLYKGGNLRPDVFYLKDPRLGLAAYRKTFDGPQQKVIKASGEPRSYNIGEAAEHFDVSLLWVLLKNLCHLSTSTRLYRNLSKVVTLRNEAVHSTDYFNSVDDLDEKLSYLGTLYDDIFDDLEDTTDADLWAARQEILQRINQRKLQAKPSISRWVTSRQYSQPQPSVTTCLVSSRPMQLTVSNDDDDDDGKLDNFGKAMVGVGVGSAIGIGLGLLGAAMSAKEDRPNTSRGRRSQEEKPEYEGWGTVGAAIGAGVGLLGALASMDFSKEEKSRNRWYQQ